MSDTLAKASGKSVSVLAAFGLSVGWGPFVVTGSDYIGKTDLANELATKDTMTGVKNKHAYGAKQSLLDQAIERDEIVEFAIGVCAINDLKYVNDDFGHEYGDAFIKEATRASARPSAALPFTVPAAMSLRLFSKVTITKIAGN